MTLYTTVHIFTFRFFEYKIYWVLEDTYQGWEKTCIFPSNSEITEVKMSLHMLTKKYVPVLYVRQRHLHDGSKSGLIRISMSTRDYGISVGNIPLLACWLKIGEQIKWKPTYETTWLPYSFSRMGLALKTNT